MQAVIQYINNWYYLFWECQKELAKIPNSFVDHIYARTKIMVCQTQGSKHYGTILQEELIVHRKQLQADKCAFLVLIPDVFFPKEKLIPNVIVLKNSLHRTGMNSCRLQICCCLSKDLLRLCIRKNIDTGKPLSNWFEIIER